ncbi:hypothetical protein K440DRAFT_661574 [Wilcoxina mikolae CBS 423.85]|nr:hypothetical protein K440DRAFT_661574 [Wilcoxina mikolae CBS 423.85]
MATFSPTDPRTWTFPSPTNPFLELQRRILLRELRAQLETTYAANFAFQYLQNPVISPQRIVTDSGFDSRPASPPIITPPPTVNLFPIATVISPTTYTLPTVATILPKKRGRIYGYGDCAETLPLAVVASVSSQAGFTEVSCLTAFTAKLCGIQSIADDGSVRWTIPLLPPCDNCKSLMGRIPGTARVLAGSGRSNAVRWTVEKQGQYICGDELHHASLTYNRFSYSAVHSADVAGIYRMLEQWTLKNRGLIWQEDVRMHLAIMWHEFILPYRDAGTIFHLNASGNIEPVMIPVNNTCIPICSVFCALGYILSTILEPPRGHALRDSHFLPLMAIMAKWCHKLCPWGCPNVVSIVGITSSVQYTMTRFLLGTSRPASQMQNELGVVHQGHSKAMRSNRVVLLESVFGSLP